MAGIVAASLAGLVAFRAGFAAVMLAVFDDIVAFPDFAFAIRTGAFGYSVGAHGRNT
jgi:hypothetical protein